ncbi:MAG: hypothetical protein ACI9CO_000434 [Candidatus Azotimanducaceae bacterium]|jgi:hypothetical protein
MRNAKDIEKAIELLPKPELKKFAPGLLNMMRKYGILKLKKTPCQGSWISSGKQHCVLVEIKAPKKFEVYRHFRILGMLR